MTKKTIKLTILFSILHFVTMIITLLWSLKGFERFDNPELEITTLEKIGSIIFPILSQPVFFLLEFTFKGGVPNTIEWTATILNSVLWGLGLTVLYHFVIEKTKKWKLSHNKVYTAPPRQL